MSKYETPKRDDSSSRISHRKVKQHSRQIELGTTAIPQLEADLIEKLKMLSVSRIPVANSKIELRVIQDSIELILVSIKTTGESLKVILREIKEAEKRGANFEERTEQLLQGNPIKESVLSMMEAMGGARMVFERSFISLKQKHEAFIRCRQRIKKSKTIEHRKRPLSQLVIEVGDYIGEPPVNPVFSIFGCLLTPNPLVCAVVVVVVLVVLEGEAGGEEVNDDEGLGDFPQPDPGGDTPV